MCSLWNYFFSKAPPPIFPRIPAFLQKEIFKKLTAIDFIHAYKASKYTRRVISPGKCHFFLNVKLLIKTSSEDRLTLAFCFPGAKTKIYRIKRTKESLENLCNKLFFFYFKFKHIEIHFKECPLLNHFINFCAEHKITCQMLDSYNEPALARYIDVLKPEEIEIAIFGYIDLPENLKNVKKITFFPGSEPSEFLLSFFNKHAEYLQNVKIHWAYYGNIRPQVVTAFYRLAKRLLNSSNTKCHIDFNIYDHIQVEETDIFKDIPHQKFEQIAGSEISVILFPTKGDHFLVLANRDTEMYTLAFVSNRQEAIQICVKKLRNHELSKNENIDKILKCSILSSLVNQFNK